MGAIRRCLYGVCGAVGIGAAHGAVAAEGEWQALSTRSPILPDTYNPAIAMTLRGDFALNTAEPMLTIDVARHPVPQCSADRDGTQDVVQLGDGLVNGHPQSFGYRCMGGQMSIVAWPTQQPASFWKAQIVAQQPLSLSVGDIFFQSANTNGKRAMSVANRMFME